MSNDPYIGEIQMLGENFAPRGWALCDGQLLAISDNDALFSLLGTMYGGDGRTSFGLPDLRCRVPLGQGQGAGLSSRAMGSRGGQEEVTIAANEWPQHSHTWQASTDAPSTGSPVGNMLAAADVYSAATPDTALAGSSVTWQGGGRSHNNMQPFLVINYAIAIFGIYPSRN